MANPTAGPAPAIGAPPTSWPSSPNGTFNGMRISTEKDEEHGASPRVEVYPAAPAGAGSGTAPTAEKP